MSRRVIWNSVLYTGTAVLRQGIGLLLLPVYTAVLSPEEYGVYALVQVYLLLFTIGASLQLHASVSRYYVRYLHEPDRRGAFLTTLLSAVLLAAGVLSIAAFAAGDALIDLLFSSDGLVFDPYFALGTAIGFFHILATVPQGVLLVQERGKVFATGSLLSTLVLAVWVVVELWVLGTGVPGALRAELAGAVTAFVVFGAASAKAFRARIDPGLLAGPLRYSIPLIPHAAAGYVFTYSDRLVLERFVPLAAIGVYAVADRLAMAVKLVVNNFNAAFSPFFMKTAEVSRERAQAITSEIASVTLYLFGGLVLALSLFALEIVSLLTGPGYGAAYTLVPVLAASYLFRSMYCFATPGLFFAERTGRVAMVTLVAAVLNLGLNILFIPRFGLLAAAGTTLLSFAATFVLGHLLAARIFPIPLELRRLGATLGSLAVIIGVYYAIDLGGGSDAVRWAVRGVGLAAYLGVGLLMGLVAPDRIAREFRIFFGRGAILQPEKGKQQ